MFATNPARLNGLRGKGVIVAGADADLIVVDSTERRVASHTNLHIGHRLHPL